MTDGPGRSAGGENGTEAEAETESGNVSGRVLALQYAALGLGLLVATVHITHPTRGLPRLVAMVSADPALLLTDPRPLALVLSGLAIVAGINAAIVGVRRRPLYALGMGLMALHLVGYALWHLSGHGGFLPGRGGQYHSVGILLGEVASDGWVLASKLTEAALLAVLAALYRRDTGTDVTEA